MECLLLLSEMIRNPEDPVIHVAGGRTGSRSLDASATTNVHRGSDQEIPDQHARFHSQRANAMRATYGPTKVLYNHHISLF
jgi:hypothetical protein